MSVSMLAMRSQPAVRDGFEVFTRALEAGLDLDRAMSLLDEPAGDGAPGASYGRTVGALFASVAILDRAAAYGARPQIRGLAQALALPFLLRGKARIAALEKLTTAERASAVAGLLKAAKAYVPWLLQRDGELPSDMDGQLPLNNQAPEPPAPIRVAWPTEPMRMELVKVPTTVATSTVHRDQSGRIDTTVVATVQAA